MNLQYSSRRLWITLVGMFALALAAPAFSQRPGGGGHAGHAAVGRPGGAAHQHFDARFAHDRYYYNRGYSAPHRPPGGLGGLWGPHGGRYWFHGGNWYRWSGSAWVVWRAPLGVFLPFLPPYFTTIWWYGMPYYYANDTYYIWDDSTERYQVVEPPAGIDKTATTQAPASDQLFAYPKNGQSAAQQKTDRNECDHWAAEQSGFDPSAADGGVPADPVTVKRNDYLRAEATCLEGRGYTVE